MTRLPPLSALACTLLLSLSAPASAQPAPATTQAPKVNTAQVLRGAYLMKTSACMDCHTPLKMGANGPEPDLSGFTRATRRAPSSAPRRPSAARG